MGTATGLVGGLGALTRGAGATGFGAQRKSTGLAGSPVPTNFGRASGAMGFCGEQGVGWTSRDTSVCSQGPHVCPRGVEGAPGSERRSDAPGHHSTHLGNQTHLRGRWPWAGTQGLLLERHGLQGHLPGLGRVAVVSGQAQAPPPAAPKPGTHQQHSLLADEGLLQGQRGGVQAWNCRGAVSGDVDPEAWEMGGIPYRACPSSAGSTSPHGRGCLCSRARAALRTEGLHPARPWHRPGAATDLALALALEVSGGRLCCRYRHLRQAGLPLSCGGQWLLASPGPGGGGRRLQWLPQRRAPQLPRPQAPDTATACVPGPPTGQHLLRARPLPTRHPGQASGNLASPNPPLPQGSKLRLKGAAPCSGLHVVPWRGSGSSQGEQGCPGARSQCVRDPQLRVLPSTSSCKDTLILCLTPSRAPERTRHPRPWLRAAPVCTRRAGVCKCPAASLPHPRRTARGRRGYPGSSPVLCGPQRAPQGCPSLAGLGDTKVKSFSPADDHSRLPGSPPPPETAATAGRPWWVAVPLWASISPFVPSSLWLQYPSELATTGTCPRGWGLAGASSSESQLFPNTLWGWRTQSS